MPKTTRLPSCACSAAWLTHRRSSRWCVSYTYTGAPLRVHGRTIGTFCAMHGPLGDDEVSAAQKAMLQQKAKEAGQLVEALVEANE